MPSPTDADLHHITEQLAFQLSARRRTLGTAESCTGGWIGKLCTDLPGSSAWYASGVICYSNITKMQQLGVSKTLIEQQGPVSEAVALSMARGAMLAMASDYGLSVTGLAGPGGGSAELPVGTVWIGWASPKAVLAESFFWQGTRDEIRRYAVAAAMQGLMQRIRQL